MKKEPPAKPDSLAVYTVQPYGSSKKYVLLMEAGSEQDRLIRDLRGLRYCHTVKYDPEKITDPGLLRKAYGSIIENP